MPGPCPAVHAVADGDALVVVDFVVVVVVLIVVVVVLLLVVDLVVLVDASRGVVVIDEDATAGVLDEVLEVVLNTGEVLIVELVVENDNVVCVVLDEVKVLRTSEVNVV